MKKTSILAIIAFFYFLNLGNKVDAQQRAYYSGLHESQIYWNPAMIGYHEKSEISSFFRAQWLGFNDAPLTGFVAYQNPLLRQNSSIGIMMDIDKIGPFKTVGMKFNYVYKLFTGYNGRLAFSLSAGVNNINTNTSTGSVTDISDLLLQQYNISRYLPAFGFGMYYNSNIDKYQGDSHFAGFSISELLSNDIISRENVVNKVRQLNALVGVRLHYDKNFWEHRIMSNYINPDIWDVIYALNFEYYNSLWAGINAGIHLNLGLQAGVILDDFINRDAVLRLGIASNIIARNNFQNQLGPSLELLVSYQWE